MVLGAYLYLYVLMNENMHVKIRILKINQSLYTEFLYEF